jgi:hypothetical protein
MNGPRLYANSTLRAALLALVAACAGCWEKIEYTGPRTTKSIPPAETAPPATGPATAATTTPPPQAEQTPVAETPVAVAETPTQPPVEDTAALPPPPPPDISDTPPPPPPADDDLYKNPPETASSDTPPPPTPPDTAPTGTENAASAAAAPPAAGDAAVNASTSNAANATTTETPAPAPPPLNNRRAAWLLGSRLSVAALANDRSVAAQSVPIWFEDANTAAKFLGTSVVELPSPAAAEDAAPASKQVINYLLQNGQRIGRDLSKQHSAEESSLFEVALKSNILLLLYTPESTAGSSIATAISTAAPQAKLPSELWQPLVDALNAKSSVDDVRNAVRKLHVEVEKYLSQEGEPKGQ